jgi:hypothetical protein
MKKIYIAYGANTNRRAMARRCPNAKPIGAGFIVGQRFKFNNVADIVPHDTDSKWSLRCTSSCMGNHT